MRRAAVLLIALLFPACTTAPDDRPLVSEQRDIRLELHGNRIFVPVLINGVPVQALLDSGAEMSVVDDGLAERLRLAASGSDQAKGTGGTVEARFASPIGLGFADIQLQDRTVAVIDLAEISQRLIGRPVEMIVGREVFDAGRLFLDLQQGLVRTVSRDTPPPGTRFTLTTRAGIETFPVSVEGHPAVQADFDLGNGGDLLLGKAYAERIGLSRPERITGRRSGGGLGGGVERELVVLKSVRIGGELFENVTAAIDPSEGAADFNIGNSILRNFRITTDFPQRALWLERRK